MANPVSIYAQVGRVLRERRLRAGLTQQVLAERAGLSVPFVSFLESGRKKGSLDSYGRLAKALNVPMSELFHAPVVTGWSAGRTVPLLEGLTAAENQAVWRLVKAFKRRRPARY